MKIKNFKAYSLYNDTTLRQCCGSVGVRCLFDPWAGWVKNQDPGSGSGMNILGIRISESLETIFGLKYFFKFFDAFADRGIFFNLDQGSGTRDGKHSDPV
jgi:hypothetical protein